MDAVMTDAFATFFVDINAGDGLAALTRRLAEHGIVTFEGVHDAHELLRVAQQIGEIVPHRDSDARGVTTLSGRERSAPSRPGYLGFGTGELLPHTDGSGVTHPPTVVMLICERPAEHGGDAVVVDGCSLYNRLQQNHPEALIELCRPLSARFGGASGHRGAVFERPVAARLSIRFRQDGLARFDAPVDAVETLARLINEQAVRFILESGQGYAVQNGRWLHGRTAYKGHRRVHRVLLGPPIDVPIGFAPPCVTR